MSSGDDEIVRRSDGSANVLARGGDVTEVRAAGRRNRLLGALPQREYEQLTASAFLVSVEPSTPVFSENEPLTQVYFPLDSVFSLVSLLDSDMIVEAATIGREGMVSLPVFLGAATSPNRCFCQVPGEALCVDVTELRAFLAEDGVLHELLHRYTQAVLVSLAQNVACNRVHGTDQRLARWLLQTADRVGVDHFPLTQESVAQMLGVRRGTVSAKANALQRRDLITYSRGRITIVDRVGLEATACSCYDLVRREFAKVGSA